jgi:hypothetical protein
MPGGRRGMRRSGPGGRLRQMASTTPLESERRDIPTSHNHAGRRDSEDAEASQRQTCAQSSPPPRTATSSGPNAGTSYVAHCPIFPGCCENQRLRRRFWGVSVLTLRRSQRPQKPLKIARQHSVGFGTSRAPRNAPGQGFRVTRAVPFPESRVDVDPEASPGWELGLA